MPLTDPRRWGAAQERCAGAHPAGLLGTPPLQRRRAPAAAGGACYGLILSPNFTVYYVQSRVACSRHHRSVTLMSDEKREFLLLPREEQIREMRGRDRALLDAFANSIRTSDIHAYAQSLEALQHSLLWPRVVRAVEHLDPPAKFRRHCLWSWLKWGDSLRSEVNNDLLLIKLLRVLLPKYKGPALTLYRGETTWNRRRRTYGMSWSTEIEVATQFANGILRTFQGGSVVLKTRAPARSIICAPELVTNRFAAEHEILVDRRKLGRVHVVERLAELSFEKLTRAAERENTGRL